MLTYTVANWQRVGLPGESMLKQVNTCFGKPPFGVADALLVSPPHGERIVMRGAHGLYRRRSEGEDEEDGTVSERISRATGAPRDDSCRSVCGLRRPEPSPSIDPEEEVAVNEFAQTFVGTLERELVGWKAFASTGNLSMPHRIRLKEPQRISLHNDNVECRLFRLDMIKDGMRDRPGRPEQPANGDVSNDSADT